MPATMHYRVIWHQLYGLLRADLDQDAAESGVAAQFVEGEQTGLSKVSKLAAVPRQTSLSKVSKPERPPSANPNRSKDHTETTQRNGPSVKALDDESPPATLPPVPATPEERLAQFEATQARMRSLRGLS